MTWNIIESNDDIHTTAQDSGSYYRFLTHGNQLFLPTAALVAGGTHFWCSFVEPGNVVAGDNEEIDYIRNDAGILEGFSEQNVGNLQTRHLYQVRYIGDGQWASNLISNT